MISPIMAFSVSGLLHSNISVKGRWDNGIIRVLNKPLCLPCWKQNSANLSDTCGFYNVNLRQTRFRGGARLHCPTRCKVKNDELDETVSGEPTILDEQILIQDLQVAINEENYTRAAKIRDSLRIIKEDSKASVLAANARFYESFKNGDLAAMQRLWSKGDNSCCVHPGASGIIGYDSVIESWEIVWMSYDFPLDIELKDVRVHFRGDVGFVTCVEFVRTKGSSWGAQFVTNVFEKVNGQWLICVHHASPVDL